MVRQQLLDADITIGIPVAIAGGVAAFVMRSWFPLIIVGLAFGAIAGYHHWILSDPSINDWK